MTSVRDEKTLMQGTEKLQELSIRDLIELRAQQNPDGVFLLDPSTGERVTYGQLLISSKTIVETLVGFGAQAGESVAFAMTNGAVAAKTILGILYGGFLATAVNLVSGRQTISYVLEHSDSRFVFCQNDTFGLLKSDAKMNDDLMLINLDAQEFDASQSTRDESPVLASSDGLLMYTSGTTGVPKGVVLTHANLIAGGHNTMLAHELNGDDVGLCVLPLYHINGLCVTILGTLVAGGSVIVPKKFSVGKFWDYMRDHKASWFSVVPTQISYLLHDAEQNGHSLDGLDALRFGRSASAPLSPDVQKAFEERFRVPVIETMGLTETAAQILSNPMQGPRKIGSPGIAFGNEVIIADEQQQELARGTEGEVLVRGANVMRLYRNNEEATNASLVEGGWLRTGDLGRMDEDGYIFITGRLKELIIKGGENIAPREIDDALYTHPDVVEAAAFACDCSQYGQRVEAGVMVSEGSKITEEGLKEICRDRLGSFKTPDRIHFFPELPKGPSGKIQRLKLAELTQAQESDG